MYAATPRFAATSRSRFELELFGLPTTITDVDLRRQNLHRVLAILRRVADVVLLRPDDPREARASAPRRSRRRRRPTAWSASRRRARRGSRPTSRSTSATDSTRCMPPSHCPIVPSTSGWPAWPIITISRPCVAHLRDLDVHLGDQRAGRVEHAQAARVGLRAHRLRHAVRGEDDGARPRGTSSSSSTNTAPFALQVVDDEPVVHDLVAHVDRRAVLRERLLDDRDRAVDAGAEAARIGEQDLHQRSFWPPRRDSRRGRGSCRRSAAPRRR